MLGLLLKDFYTIKKQLRFYLVMIVFFIFLGVSNTEDTSYMFMLSFFAIMLPMTALAYDERSNWFKYALTMPLRRRDLVFSKYVLGFVFVVAAFVINVLLSGGLIWLGKMGVIQEKAFTFGELLGIAGISALVSMFFMALVMPLFYKLGVETGRIAMLALAFIPTILSLALLKLVPEMPAFVPVLIETVENHAVLFEMLGVGVLIVGIVISIWISVRIFEKKEF